LKLKHGAFIARQCTLHTIGVVFVFKRKRDFRRFDFSADVDHVTAFATRFAK
jgi:hypothetical protein